MYVYAYSHTTYLCLRVRTYVHTFERMNAATCQCYQDLAEENPITDQ